METITPAYYSIDLKESDLRVEASNDDRAGIARFTPGRSTGDSFYVIVMGFDTMYNDSTVRILSESSVEYSNPVHRWYQGTGRPAGFSGHHMLRFSRPALSYGIIHGYTSVRPGEKNGKSGLEGPVAAYFEFTSESSVSVAVGSSFVSTDKSRVNLQAELGGNAFDLEGLARRVSDLWEEKLSALDVQNFNEREDFDATVTESHMRLMYTSLWHSLLLPRHHSDSDGEYLSFGGSLELMRAEGFTYMDDFSAWDTYRATTPLQLLLYPEMAEDLVHSLVVKAEQGGWLPIFPAWNSYTAEMIGDHCAVIIADAFVKEILDKSSELANVSYEIVRRNALELPPVADYLEGKGRRGLESYMLHGFIPLENSLPGSYHSNEQVSRTLEYAYNDYVVSQFADILDFKDDSELFSFRSENYRNVIDADGVGFVRGRHRSMEWDGDDAEFDPNQKYSWLTEATPWQYTWYVPHNVEALIQLYGGDKSFTDKLNSFFDGGSYNHGNEPDHQAAFMYAYAQNSSDGAWRVQQRVRSILDDMYRSGPGGLPGNEDGGQMSSWFVMAGLGLYQVCPGCGGHSEYVLSSPVFDLSRIRVTEGNWFEIFAVKSSDSDMYIQSAVLNGEEFDCAFIPDRVIRAGGTLKLTMGMYPNKTWANSGRSCLARY
eukprot:CAMPEP_0185018502 /NCGR_PEP_ID=MMETSP1103-20130426/1207_1 /TAXON_ID=36769 /ORGANISM="Paraphysomonas bandaiensis, Strain Caron Lab Isolate" /LENGTH=656 /DNA_ID=CAMNT_0027548339 /DNA_START=385 /DNA_END=2355 /DNA_ORIENTATION=-